MSAHRPISLPALDALGREFDRISADQQATAAPPRLRAPHLAWSLGMSLALIALLATPPGHAARGWVGELFGIGKVGGPPSIANHVIDTPRARVVARGVVGGRRYEVSAYTDSQGGSCFSLLFAGVPGSNGTIRCNYGRFPESRIRLDGFTVAASDGYGVSVPNPNGTWSTPALGIVSPQVARLRVTYDVHGKLRTLEPTIAGLPRSRQNHDATGPRAAFFFLPQYVARASRAEVATYDDQGNEIGRRQDHKLLNLVQCRGGLNCPGK